MGQQQHSRRAQQVLLLLLGAAACCAAAEEQQQRLQWTEKFLFRKISFHMLHLTDNMRQAVTGQLKHQPIAAVKKLNVSCLNSVAPEPLNWNMWCPDTHASVTQWVDAVGSTHRKIQLQPMPTMTSNMAVWFMTPLFPKTMEFNGSVFTKNTLWHPLDHKPKQDFKLAPGKGIEPPALMVKLDEAYRSLAGAPAGYKTELWVAAMDLPHNLPHNRYVLGFDVLGFQAFTLIVEFADTPEGMVASIEVIVGAAAKGYDAANPHKGVLPAVAKAANTMLLETVMAPYRANGDFEAALDAVTRHVVEEFGNLPQFVPRAWHEDPRGRIAAELAAFKKNIISMVTPTKTKTAASPQGNATKAFAKGA